MEKKERYSDIAKVQQKLINKILSDKSIDEELAKKMIQEIIKEGLGVNNTIVLKRGVTCRITGSNNFSKSDGELHYQLVYTNVDENGSKDHAYPPTTEKDIIDLLILKITLEDKKEKNDGVVQPQKVDRTSSLIEQLEKGSLREKLLSRKLRDYTSKSIVNYRTLKKGEKLSKSLYEIFLRSIKPDQADKLREIDSKIKKLSDEITKKTGWYITREYAEKIDDHVNVEDPEFRTFDTYRLNRDENGFYISEEGAFNSYFANIHEVEIHFYASNRRVLDLIHELYSLKERIMSGEFEVKDESVDREFLINIAEYLGFKNIPEQNKALGKKA